MKPLFPYFGGKARAGSAVWAALGDVACYVEPFCGSAAVLLARPGGAGRWETINDADAMVANFWRAMGSDPDSVAEHCHGPPNEADLRARHRWLRDCWDASAVELDPEWYDVKAAGWWAWGASCWVGSGFAHSGSRGTLNPKPGGVCARDGAARLAEVRGRLARVRVLCGDFRRVLGRSYLFPSTVSGGGRPCGSTGVFLDPPYLSSRAMRYRKDGEEAATSAVVWCRENQGNQWLRIVLAGYEGDYDLPGWRCIPWRAKGGYRKSNQGRERLWLSPGCLDS